MENDNSAILVLDKDEEEEAVTAVWCQWKQLVYIISSNASIPVIETDRNGSRYCRRCCRTARRMRNIYISLTNKEAGE